MLGGHGIMINVFEARSTTDDLLFNHSFAAALGAVANASKTNEAAVSEMMRILFGVVPGIRSSFDFWDGK